MRKSILPWVLGALLVGAVGWLYIAAFGAIFLLSIGRLILLLIGVFIIFGVGFACAAGTAEFMRNKGRTSPIEYYGASIGAFLVVLFIAHKLIG